MLLLLPGLICDARMFAPQLAALPDARAVDGYGTRDSLADMARLVLDQAPARFDLFGHSMGGRIALEIVRLAPQRVRRLALASTGVHGVGEGEQAKRRALTEVGHRWGFAALVDQWLPPMIAEPARHDTAIAGPLREMCLAQGQDVWDAQVAALLARREAASLLSEIRCPTLVMTGAADKWSPPEQHCAIADAIPGATLEIVAAAGHMLTHEAPGTVTAAIRRWLATPIEQAKNSQGEHA